MLPAADKKLWGLILSDGPQFFQISGVINSCSISTVLWLKAQANSETGQNYQMQARLRQRTQATLEAKD